MNFITPLKILLVAVFTEICFAIRQAIVEVVAWFIAKALEHSQYGEQLSQRDLRWIVKMLENNIDLLFEVGQCTQIMHYDTKVISELKGYIDRKEQANDRKRQSSRLMQNMLNIRKKTQRLCLKTYSCLLLGGGIASMLLVYFFRIPYVAECGLLFIVLSLICVVRYDILTHRIIRKEINREFRKNGQLGPFE